MKKRKRLIGVLLCAAMLLGSMQAYFAGAEEGDEMMGTEEFAGQTLQANSDLSASTNEGLLAHLKFDDDVTDATGKGTPQLVGSATYEAGINGKAIRLGGNPAEGNSNRVELTGRDDLKFGEGDSFSVGFWYKADKTLSDSNIIGSKSWANAGNEGWNIVLASSKMNISPISRIKESDIQCTIQGINGSGKWMYAVVTRTADAQNALYINGNKVAIAARGKGGTNSKSAGAVCIGADWEGKFGPGNGVALDEVKLWNRVLTAEEVQYLYQTSPEITAMSVSGPATAAVGESGTTVTLNAKVTKHCLEKQNR